MDIPNKILLIIFFMSILNVFRHLYYFTQAMIKSNTDQPMKYILSGKGLLILGVSLAYILSSIFDGIFLN